MSYKSLDEFLVRLESEGELVRVDSSSDHFHSRKLKDKAVMIEHPDGSEFPQVLNLFGTAKRMAWALGLDDLDELNQRLNRMLDLPSAHKMGGLIGRAGEFVSLLHSVGAAPGRNREIPGQEVVITSANDINLRRLPVTRDAQDRAMLTGLQLIRLDEDRQLTSFTDGYVQDEQTIVLSGGVDGVSGATSAALVIGGDPAQIWSASVPLPLKIDPYLLAGWVRRKPVRYMRCVSNDLKVPLDAELVLEGRLVDRVFEVSALTHRRAAIIPAMLPAERYWIGKAAERFFLPLLRFMMDEIVDFNLMGEVGVIAVNAAPRKAIFGLWGMALTAQCKTLIAVDADVNPHDMQSVNAAIEEYVHWQHDIILTHDDNGLRKVGIDATGKNRL